MVASLSADLMPCLEAREGSAISASEREWIEGHHQTRVWKSKRSVAAHHSRREAPGRLQLHQPRRHSPKVACTALRGGHMGLYVQKMLVSLPVPLSRPARRTRIDEGEIGLCLLDCVSRTLSGQESTKQRDSAYPAWLQQGVLIWSGREQGQDRCL